MSTGALISAGVSFAGALMSASAADDLAAEASAAHAEAMGFAAEEREELGLIAQKERARTDVFRDKTRDYILGSGIDPQMSSQIKKQASAQMRNIQAQGAMGGMYAGDQARQVEFNQANAMTQGAFQTNAQRMAMARAEGDISNVLNLETKAADTSAQRNLKSQQSQMLYGQAAGASAAAAEGMAAGTKALGNYFGAK